MGENTKDIMLYIIGVLIAVVPLIRELMQSGKKHWVYIAFLFMCTLVILILGIDKVKRENKEKITSEKKVDILNTTLSRIENKIARDSLKNKEFEDKLVEKFKIKRDSSSNEPVPTTYNTKIRTAGTVNIGR